jgi:acyl dehydratase
VSPRLDALSVGDEVLRTSVTFERADLVRYAGASGDFNVIHWNGRVAKEVGLPDVIAHGMLTMARAVEPVVAWCGDPGAVVEYGVRFTKPVVVPDPGEAVVELVGTVGAVDADAGTVRVDLTATFDGTQVLGKARAVVRLPA